MSDRTFLAAYLRAVDLAARGLRHRKRAAAMRQPFSDELEPEHTCADGHNTGGDGECLACGERDCPGGEPLHYHHDGCPWCDFGQVPDECDRLAAENAALRDDPTRRYMERDEIEGRTRAILAAHAFAVAYEAWNEADCGEHENDDDVGCAACQKEEPLRLAKVAAYEAWRKARAEADGGGDE